MRQRYIRILAGLILLLVAPSARAETWTIACDDNFPPYNHYDAGKLVGLDIDLIGALVVRAGAVPRFEAQSWNRVRERLDRGDLDAAFQFVGNAERFEKYYMIGPFRTGLTVFAARRDAAVGYERLEDLQPYRIGMVRGFSYGPSFDAGPGLRKDDTAGDNRQLVRMLAAGRIDLAIGDERVLNHHLRQESLQNDIRLLPRPYDEVKRYIAVPRGKPAIAARLTRALAELQENGELAAILRRWE